MLKRRLDLNLNTVTLYAMWFSAQPKTMQDFGDYCNQMETDQVLTLRDTRDNNNYTVAKLKDGQCWMTQNLRIGDKSTLLLTSIDTDTMLDYTLPSRSESPSAFSSSNAHVIYVKDDVYGGYYTWNIAMLDSGALSSYPRYDNAGRYSICPRGWKIPLESDASNLIKEYPDVSISNAPANFVYGGYYNNDSSGTINGLNSYAYYWDNSTASSGHGGSDGPGHFYINKSGSNSTGWNGMTYSRGLSVRCLSRNEKTPPKLTFRAGDGIESIRIATESDPPVTAYPDKERVIYKPVGTKLIVTVIPKPGYKLTGWTRSSSSGTLSNNELLTTTYTVGSGDEVLTANGVEGIYQSMQDLADCDATGTNVTDVRDQKSYAVAKIGAKCYMLSDLRLDAGTVLDNTTSSTSGSFTVPNATWDTSAEGGFRQDATKAQMIKCDEKSQNCNSSQYNFTISAYYYNYRAATANTNSTAYSICPKNWSLPNYNDDVTATNAWENGANPAMLSPNGYYRSGYQYILPYNYGYWQSSQSYRDSNGYYYYSYTLYMNNSSSNGATTVNRGGNSTGAGVAIRCMH